MAAIKIGYARVSTDAQDLTAERNALKTLGVDEARIYVDHGLSGTNRATRVARSARRVPRRRHARSDKARPARALAA